MNHIDDHMRSSYVRIIMFSTGPKEGDQVRGCYGDVLCCQKGENKLMCQMEESSHTHTNWSTYNIYNKTEILDNILHLNITCVELWWNSEE